MKFQKISDKELDEILEKHKSDKFVYDDSKIYIDGLLYYRESICVNDKISTKSTAKSLIEKEPYFDYGFMEDVYRIIDEAKIDDMDAIHCTRPIGKGRRTHTFRFHLDLYSAYPHVLKFERLPIDGKIYFKETKWKMNFYIYRGKYLKNGSLIVDELKEYIVANNLGECEFVFATDYRVGSKMGDWLINKAFTSKKTKQSIKGIHYGFFQKRYIKYDFENDCYVRNSKNTHELLMVAILSHLTLTMIHVRDAISDKKGMFVVDAYHWDEETDIEEIKKTMSEKHPNYNYRIYDLHQSGDPIYKSYPDLPEHGKGKPRGKYRRFDL